jgi:hypothetical protein
MTTRKIDLTTKEVLEQHGFCDGRLLTLSKSGYAHRHRGHFLVFNSQIFTQHCRILKGVDLDLTLDAEKLTKAARVAGQNIYVLNEASPSPFWNPGSLPISQVLRNAVWWSRIFPGDEDCFLPLKYRPTRHPNLLCTTGLWRGREAFCLDFWTNPKWNSCNTSGAVVELFGGPPNGLRRNKNGDAITSNISTSRGQYVRPSCFHRSGLLEYIWFSNFQAVPALLYDWAVRFLGESIDFTWHRDSRAIHMWRAGEVVGLLWPCGIAAPEVVATARRHLHHR